MFSGIVESAARVVSLRREDENLHITLECEFVDELHIDQSVAHNGVCLTVVSVDGNTYTVTAIKETLERSNLGRLEVGSLVNVERSVTVNGVSLTVCEPKDMEGENKEMMTCLFSNAIIPYTHDHTNFCDIKPGTVVNLEFDILGKYLARIASI